MRSLRRWPTTYLPTLERSSRPSLQSLALDEKADLSFREPTKTEWTLPRKPNSQHAPFLVTDVLLIPPIEKDHLG
jgi:hypothetical protein